MIQYFNLNLLFFYHIPVDNLKQSTNPIRKNQLTISFISDFKIESSKSNICLNFIFFSFCLLVVVLQLFFFISDKKSKNCFHFSVDFLEVFFVNSQKNYFSY